MATQIGFVGLGAMGLGMASNLQSLGKYAVRGYDVYPPSIEKLVAKGATAGLSSRDVADKSPVLVCMAANCQQIDEILFNSTTGALESKSMKQSVSQGAITKQTQHYHLEQPFYSAPRCLLAISRLCRRGLLRQGGLTFLSWTPRCPAAQSRPPTER